MADWEFGLHSSFKLFGLQDEYLSAHFIILKLFYRFKFQNILINILSTYKYNNRVIYNGNI